MARQLSSGALLSQTSSSILSSSVKVNEDAAERFLLSAEETFRLLVSQPQMGRKLESRNSMLAGIRIFPVKNFKKYLIFYKPLRDGIEVVRVLHGARDLRSIFEM